MAHNAAKTSNLLSLHCDGVQQVMERASYGTVSIQMAHDGDNTSQGIILHCDGVEQGRENISYGTHS